MLDLKNSSFCIFGLPDSGKSTLACYLLSQFGPRAIIYDTLSEYPDKPHDCYRPKERGSTAELEEVVRGVLKNKKYSLFLLDEANRFCPSKPQILPQSVCDMNDWRAHYGLSIGFISRRVVQLHQDLTDMASFLFCFKQTGRGSIKTLNDIVAGLGDKCLNLKPYHFIVRMPDGSLKMFKPVPERFATSKKL